MTKNRSMRIAVLVLALALITCCFVGTTFAKYTSKATGSDTLTVAKWSVTDAEGTKLANFDLAATITDWANPASTNADAAVATGKIAPGTAGAFGYELVINAEVDAEYTVVFTATNANNVPIEYSLDPNAADDAWKTDISALNITDGIYTHETGESDLSDVIYWRWVFDGDDAADTALGEMGTAPTVEIQAVLTVTQKDTRP